MDNKTLLITLLLIFFGFNFNQAQKSYKTDIFEGNKRFDKKNYEDAAAKYLEAVKKNEKDYAAHYNLGNALYKTGKYEEAKAEFQKAQQLAQTLPDKAAALHNLGNAHMETNEPEKAAEFYKQSLKQDPHSETTRRNYEIALLKEKEKNQQNKKDDSNNGGGEDQNNKNKGQKTDQKGKSQQQGQNQNNKGQGEGNDNNERKNEGGKLPKGMEDAILNRVSNKERETARRILNKDSYSMPESNDKDW